MTDNEPEKFWMVYCPSNQLPKFKHPSGAESEACRLLLKHPDQEFWVLEATARLRIKPLPPVFPDVEITKV